jgi:hypothetical protein
LPDTREQILRRDWSPEFIDLMQNRVLVSHFKYGWASDNFSTGLVNAVACMEQRIQKYKETGNTEWLVDVANFAHFEFKYPQHPQAHFRATDSDESPGIVGITAKELIEYDQ